MLKKNEQPLGSVLRSAAAAVSNRKKRKSKGRFHSGLVGKLLIKTGKVRTLGLEKSVGNNEFQFVMLLNIYLFLC